MYTSLMDTTNVTPLRPVAWPNHPPVIAAETPGWTCTVYPMSDAANFWKVIAVQRQNGKPVRTIHAEKLTAAQVIAYEPKWRK